MKPKQSCDRCFNVRAKCAYPPGGIECDRCRRLRRSCSTTRVTLPRGRRRNDQGNSRLSDGQLVWFVNGEVVQTTAEPRPASSGPRCNPPRLGAAAVDLAPVDSQLLCILWSRDDFVRTIAIGPSFEDAFHDSIYLSFDGFPGLLKEAFLATSAAFVQIRYGWPDHHSLKFQRSAIALRRLRQYRDVDAAHLRVVAALGISLVAFEILTLSSSSHTILKYTLTLLAPWYPSLLDDPILSCHMHHLLFMHMIECLVRREIPVVKPQDRNQPVVDVALGLCAPLLAIFFEVCELAHATKHDEHLDSAQKHRLWSNSMAKLQRWTPRLSPGLDQACTAEESTLMIIQARLQQQAVLLLIHRFIHQYDEGDESASSQSQSILSTLEVCFKATGQYPLYVCFPILVALIEITDANVQRKAISDLTTRQRPLYSKLMGRLCVFLEAEWQNRSAGCKDTWLGRIDTLPALVFLP